MASTLTTLIVLSAVLAGCASRPVAPPSTDSATKLISPGRVQTLTQDGVTLDVTQASLTLAQASERIGVATTGLARAEENYRVTSKRFKEGLVINSDMLDAEYALTSAKTNHTQTLVDFELAQARLTRAIGE